MQILTWGLCVCVSRERADPDLVAVCVSKEHADPDLVAVCVCPENMQILTWWLCVCADNMQIRLAGINRRRYDSGRVEIRLGRDWGTVCDDNFDANAARVVCRQLRYPSSVLPGPSPS